MVGGRGRAPPRLVQVRTVSPEIQVSWSVSVPNPDLSRVRV